MPETPSPPRTHASHAKILVTLAAGFFIAAIALIATNLQWARKLNQNELEKEIDVVKSVLEQLKQGVGYTLLPEANWDDAYTMFVEPIDLERARSQVGSGALRDLALEGFYIFDPSNRFVYGIFEGGELRDVSLIDDTDFSAFAAQVRRRA